MQAIHDDTTMGGSSMLASQQQVNTSGMQLLDLTKTSSVLIS